MRRLLLGLRFGMLLLWGRLSLIYQRRGPFKRLLPIIIGVSWCSGWMSAWGGWSQWVIGWQLTHKITKAVLTRIFWWIATAIFWAVTITRGSGLASAVELVPRIIAAATCSRTWSLVVMVTVATWIGVVFSPRLFFLVLLVFLLFSIGWSWLCCRGAYLSQQAVIRSWRLPVNELQLLQIKTNIWQKNIICTLIW